MHYRRVGDVPRKRHTVHRGDDGERRAEELLGHHGFSDNSTLVYHRRSPSAVLSIDALPDSAPDAAPLTGPVHLRTGELPPGGDVVRDRRVIGRNEQLVVSVVNAVEGGPLHRNAAGDELVFVREGAARLESALGPIDVCAHDYVVIPAGVTHQWVAAAPLTALVIEARGHVRVPARYRSVDGQLLEHAPYCERDMRAPETLPAPIDDGPVDVVVRTRAGLAVHRCAHHPFDVVGWDGGLYPWALSIADFEPIVGSLHQPPPVHQTFEGPGFVVCSFVPRPYDFHPDAVKVPYHHANVDCDEILYYVAGSFMSRKGAGIAAGSITIHPPGFVHGPQPGSWEASVERTSTDEVAVMIDTFQPLAVTATAFACADQAYVRSWSGATS